MAVDHDLVAQRKRKLELWASAGGERYPYAFRDRSTALEVRRASDPLQPGETSSGPEMRIAGRLQNLREVGKNAFAPLRDASGTIQVHLQADRLGAEEFRRLLSVIDGGDLVGVTGTPSRTRSGEPSLLAKSVVLLVKALNPPPEKWHGLKDPEVRMRQRYVDLFTSESSFSAFTGRSVLLREIRTFLGRVGFLEVETPTLGRIASGASARPFTTHYNYLDEDFKLRISIELYLKRLLVGGFERVYEIGKTFRNEDMDTTHIPEFTMLELYWAYVDYEDIAGLVEGLLETLAQRAAELAPGERTDTLRRSFTPPFARVDFVDSLERESGIPDILSLPPEKLRSLAREVGARVLPDTPVGTCLDKLFGHYVEPKLSEPTFVFDHPTSTTPLAKEHRSKPGRVERHELYYRSMELSNAYSELNDPEEQERRLQEQAGARDPDDMYAYDSDFVEALRYGMPPAGGLGIGIDRLMMVLLGQESIKDVVLFPPTRTKAE